MVMTGSVARFDAKRGYGFVHPDDGGEDVFVHQNNIDMEGFRYLNPGERVRFDIEEGARGRKAVAVQLLEERTERPPRPRQGREDHRPDRGSRPPARGGQRSDHGGFDDGRLQAVVDKLARRQERLISLLVEKEILAPGEIDRLPGLAEVTQPVDLNAEPVGSQIDDEDDEDDDLADDQIDDGEYDDQDAREQA